MVEKIKKKIVSVVLNLVALIIVVISTAYIIGTAVLYFIH